MQNENGGSNGIQSNGAQNGAKTKNVCGHWRCRLETRQVVARQQMIFAKKRPSDGPTMFLDSAGTCFVCLKETNGTGKKTCLKSLCKILNIDTDTMKQRGIVDCVLNGTRQGFTAADGEPGFEVTLCLEDCATWVEAVHDLVLQQEMLTRQLDENVTKLSSILGSSSKGQRSEEEMCQWGKLKEKLKRNDANPLTARLLEQLRIETIIECRKKAEKVGNLTLTETKVHVKDEPPEAPPSPPSVLFPNESLYPEDQVAPTSEEFPVVNDESVDHSAGTEEGSFEDTGSSIMSPRTEDSGLGIPTPPPTSPETDSEDRQPDQKAKKRKHENKTPETDDDVTIRKRQNDSPWFCGESEISTGEKLDATFAAAAAASTGQQDDNLYESDNMESESKNEGESSGKVPWQQFEMSSARTRCYYRNGAPRGIVDNEEMPSSPPPAPPMDEETGTTARGPVLSSFAAYTSTPQIQQSTPETEESSLENTRRSVANACPNPSPVQSTSFVATAVVHNAKRKKKPAIEHNVDDDGGQRSMIISMKPRRLKFTPASSPNDGEHQPKVETQSIDEEQESAPMLVLESCEEDGCDTDNREMPVLFPQKMLEVGTSSYPRTVKNEEEEDGWCWCGQPYNRAMIQCAKCQLWYHCDCEGVDENNLPQFYGWMCSSCV